MNIPKNASFTVSYRGDGRAIVTMTIAGPDVADTRAVVIVCCAHDEVDGRIGRMRALAEPLKELGST